MKRWMLHDVQNNFREIFQSCIKEPQIVCDHNTPIAVIVDITFFRKVTEFPTVADLLNELDTIKKEEPFDIDIPIRKDRFNWAEAADDISL